MSGMMKTVRKLKISAPVSGGLPRHRLGSPIKSGQLRSANCLWLRDTVDLILLKAHSGKAFLFCGYAIAQYPNFKAGKGLRDLCN